MVELATKVDDRNSRITLQAVSVLPGFHYKNGYSFSVTDLGKRGVKIALDNEKEDTAAVILPPAKVQECTMWLLWTLGQDNDNLLTEFLVVLNRLIRQTGSMASLKRGDKKRIRDALKLLKAQQPMR